MQNMSSSKSALGMDGNLAAMLGYIVGIIAIISAIIEKDNKFVRFHAFQSIFWSVMMVILMFATMIIGMILSAVLASIDGTLGGLAFGLTMLIYFVVILALIGGLIFAAIKSYGGNYFKLPIVGNLAEKFGGK